MHFIRFCLTILTVLIYTSCEDKKTSSSAPFTQGDYWTRQALTNILPYWTNHVIDSAHGSYHTTLDVDWNPVNDEVRFPSMMARHLFSYSAGYLMSGDEHHISMARNMKDYLLQYAWDEKYGGWYDALSPDGNVVQASKSTFVQLYVITGLTLYYFVTHDQTVRSFIDRSNDLLEEKAWDHEQGGYFDNLNQDWTLKNEIKTISSQLAPSSGYLLYLYLATHKEKYLRQSERILDTIVKKMVDQKSGWVLETFDKEVMYQPGKRDETEINIGHNIEVAWTLLRLYMINHREDYLALAKTLAGRLHQYGFNASRGMWYATIGNQHPDQHSNYAHWWIQAYGNMFDLCLAHLYPDEGYINAFSKGAQFWDTFFVDKKRGDTYSSVTEKGEVKDDRKANQFKASYHNMEHYLLNLLYLSCWINKEPVTLYYKITTPSEGDKLYPLPIEMVDAVVKDVRIGDQLVVTDSLFSSYIQLPMLNEGRIKLTVTPK